MELSPGDTGFKTRARRPQSGQAVLEYLLLLFVGVLVILGVVVQFNDAFRVFANNYFGEYLACLLETGELPALGGGQAPGDGACNAQFKAFSLADGRPAKGSEGGSGKTNPPDGKGNSEGDSDSEGSRYVKVAGGGGGSGSGSFGRSFVSRQQGGSEAGAGAARGSTNTYTGSTDNFLPGGLNSSRRVTNRTKREEFDGGFFIGRGERDQKVAEGGSARTVAEEVAQRQQRIKIVRKPAEAKTDDADTQMSVGDYLRYLLIAALIIALVVVLGGQVMQVSKEMD